MAPATTQSYLESARKQAIDAGQKGGLVAGSGYHYERSHCDFEQDDSDTSSTASDDEFLNDAPESDVEIVESESETDTTGDEETESEEDAVSESVAESEDDISERETSDESD